MLEIPLWRAGREQASLDTAPLPGYRGAPVAQVHQAPALVAAPAAAALRRAAPPPGEHPGPLWAAIARAGDLFEQAELGGCTPDEYLRLLTLATGTPVHWNGLAMAELAAGLRGIRGALQWQAPGGDLAAFTGGLAARPDGRACVWAPRGRVLAFVAPSNHPAVHLAWVLALAMGYTVAVRPGAADPLTPWRLVLALQAAGFPAGRVALLPGGHDLVPALVEACDRTVAYGGPALGALLGRDARVLFNGPGRSKVLVDAPADPVRAAAFLLECIAHHGGRKCTCASAVVVRGRVPGLLEQVAAGLAALPLLEPLDPAARVPAWRAATLVAQTPARAVPAGGLVFAQPELVRCPDPTRPPFGTEVPAPWATAAELPAGADPLPLLRGALAVTLLSRDEALPRACRQEPGINKVYTGLVPPWHSEPGAPHQGLLSEFLFTFKAHREVEIPWT